VTLEARISESDTGDGRWRGTDLWWLTPAAQLTGLLPVVLAPGSSSSPSLLRR
jgi:hypothetical protein